MSDVGQFLKSAFAALAADEALRSPASTLLGVSQPAQNALSTIGISTVFDLAASLSFATASKLVTIQNDPTAAEARLNAVAADTVAAPVGVPATELADQPISILRGIGTANAGPISSALDLTTVRDLALWPPYAAAKAILNLAYFPEQIADFDIEAPADLLPKSGVYPTERVFFGKLVIDTVSAPGDGAQPLEQAQPIDLVSALGIPAGFGHFATGALLTFSQSWFSQGLALGQLLHSATLAPGESTRIAVVDWSRRTRAAASEEISESELLSNAMTHSRAISEVTSATATEFQSGSSTVTTDSTTKQGGGGFGLDLGPLAIGGSGGISNSNTTVTSASSSFGARDLAANYAQDINDRSQQNASSVRNRRASIVREVSQEEHEQISTRVITNYNHMHALSIQYFEVVQAFRATTMLERAERCLFVPVKLVDFSDPALVDRWRLTLADAALTERARRQLTVEYGVVEIIPQTPRVTPGSIITSGIRSILSAAPMTTMMASAAAAQPAAAQPAPGSATAADSGAPAAGAATAPVAVATDYTRAPINAPATLLALKGWNADQLNRIGWTTGRVLMQRGSDSVFISDDVLVIGFSLREGTAARFVTRTHDGHEIAPASATGTDVAFATPVPITELDSIAVQFAGPANLQTSLVLQLNLLGTVMPLDVPIVLRPQSVPREVVKFGSVRGARELIDHLQANRLHYTQAIMRSMDAATVAALLARFTYRDLPLGMLVDTQPFAVTANFLVFKLNVTSGGEPENSPWGEEQKEWQSWLARRGLERPIPKSEIIPLPSGGVFAEAVLGRFNSAEKLDLSRFWNWQDSPIPITAPDIAAVQAGSRAQPEDITPGQLSQPVLNIQAPTALPEPTGVGAIIAAIQQGNMFRDMSGLAQSAALAQAALQATARGATAVGDQAGQNMKTVVDAQTERMRIAAQLVAASMGLPAGGGGGSAPKGRNTVSERGGELNMASAIDDAGGQAQTSGALGPGEPSDEGGTSELDGSTDGSDTTTPTSGVTELTRTFRSQREGPTGDLAAPIVRDLLADFTTDDGSGGGVQAQAFKPRSRPSGGTGGRRPGTRPAISGSTSAKIRIRLYLPSPPGVSKGWISYLVADTDGNVYREAQGWERIPDGSDFVETAPFSFPIKKEMFMMVLLMPIYSTELEGADLNNSNYEVLAGDYRAPLRYKKGQSTYSFEVDANIKSVSITKHKGVTFDKILEELGVSRFLVYGLSAENVHGPNNETIAFTYTFKYFETHLDIVPRG